MQSVISPRLSVRPLACLLFLAASLLLAGANAALAAQGGVLSPHAFADLTEQKHARLEYAAWRIAAFSTGEDLGAKRDREQTHGGDALAPFSEKASAQAAVALKVAFKYRPCAGYIWLRTCNPRDPPFGAGG